MLTHPFLTRFFAEAACVIGEKLLDFNFSDNLCCVISTINYSDAIGTPFVFVSVPCSDWSRCCAVIDCRVVMMPERAIRRIVERSHSLLIERCHFFFNCLDWCEAMHGAFWSFLVSFWVPESTKLRCCAAALLRRIDAVVASLLYHILFV